MTATVRDARPPLVVVRVLNPLLRMALRSRLGSRMGALAVVEFEGRRTARRRSVVVAWYASDEDGIVITPAPWRANFTDGRPATVCHGGERLRMDGELVREPAAVVDLLNGLVEDGAGPRSFGLRVEPGHRFDVEDVLATGRQAIVFRPVGPA